jgi:hypothetical protein
VRSRDSLRLRPARAGRADRPAPGTRTAIGGRQAAGGAAPVATSRCPLGWRGRKAPQARAWCAAPLLALAAAVALGLGAAGGRAGAAAPAGSAPVRARVSVPPPAPDVGWYGDTQDSADAAVGDPTTIDLFYGRPLSPDAWLQRDDGVLTADLAAGTATLGEMYNEWLAIADLRAAVYASEGQLEPDGVYVYAQGASAVLHALDLALWARENALLQLLGVAGPAPYPSAQDLGYRDPHQYIVAVPAPTSITPAQVGAILSGLGLPAALFAGDRIFLMPYRMPEEYGLTDVIGPDIRIWLGSDASVDLLHVLTHELGHAIHFRFGGYDTVVDQSGGSLPLSAFWQQYLTIRGLTWHDPTQYPWAQQTPECFAEDVASLFVGPDDVLGYQTQPPGCPQPSPQQQGALLAMLRGLTFSSGASSPFQQAGWLQWTYPWPNACMGYFESLLFTSETTATVGISLNAQASGGPYPVDVQGQPAPLATLQPGSAWTGSIPLPVGGMVEVDADSPALNLSWLDIYQNPAFVPIPRISGVFPDTLDSWARADVAAGVRAAVVGGYPDGTFRPADTVTRAEFARMLATGLPRLLFGAPATSAPAWPDVPVGFWAADFINAVGRYLPGAPAGQPFLPDQSLTRQEAAAWLVGAYGWTLLSADRAQALLATYPDGAAAAPADAQGFATAVELGLVQGDAGTGLLRPDDPLDRAEATILVLRALHLGPPAAVAAAVPFGPSGGSTPASGAAAGAPPQ